MPDLKAYTQHDLHIFYHSLLQQQFQKSTLRQNLAYSQPFDNQNTIIRLKEKPIYQQQTFKALLGKPEYKYIYIQLPTQMRHQVCS